MNQGDLLFCEARSCMSQVEQCKDLIIEFSIGTPEYYCVAIRRGVDNMKKSIFDIGFFANFNFKHAGILVVVIEMLSKSIQANLAYLGNRISFEITDNKSCYKILPVDSRIHDENCYAIDCGEDCADDVHNLVPVVLTESEDGIGLPGEQNRPNGQQFPANLKFFNDRRVVDFPSK